MSHLGTSTHQKTNLQWFYRIGWESETMVLTGQYPGINCKEFKWFLKKKNTDMVYTANKIRCNVNETIAHKFVEQYNETEQSSV